MPRAPRIEYEGAVYHVLCRGDRREAIIKDEHDCDLFVKTLGDCCEKTGWRVHAYVLMPNHYHLLLETPLGNLVSGMRWFQSTYTIRYNARHRQGGHVFQGRYKAIVVDSSKPGYLLTLSRYIHLNPVRAGLMSMNEAMEFRWSSAPYYKPKTKSMPAWLEIRRVLQALGVKEGRAGKAAYEAFLRQCARGEEKQGIGAAGEEYVGIRRGWYLGDEVFRAGLESRFVQSVAGGQADSYRGTAWNDHAEHQALDILNRGLKVVGMGTADISALPWTDARKRALAWLLRTRTTVTNRWVADHLGGGHVSTVSTAVTCISKQRTPEANRLAQRIKD